ncbi:MAG: hypothetical protein OXQ29_22570 [Rhodospirillaceae bacterium]|nr:hypothetical protein [Rhodospirillaceae bacterium]
MTSSAVLRYWNTSLLDGQNFFFDNREASPDPWTKEVWYYDYRTNIHHTLKKKPMRDEHLSDFIECYNPRNRHRRKATWNERDAPEGRWRSYSYEELTARDKTSLDVFWLKDKSLVDLDNLPEFAPSPMPPPHRSEPEAARSSC